MTDSAVPPRGGALLEAATFLGTPPFYLAIAVLLAFRGLREAFAFLLAIGATETVCAGIKLATRTERPIPRPRRTLYEQYDASSFPSAHTARIASNATVLYLCFPSVWSLSAGLVVVAATAWSRVAARVHWIHDVVAGAAIGAVVSWPFLGWIV
jgi:undecaprenyl-diphosphatase